MRIDSDIGGCTLVIKTVASTGKEEACVSEACVSNACSGWSAIVNLKTLINHSDLAGLAFQRSDDYCELLRHATQ